MKSLLIVFALFLSDEVADSRKLQREAIQAQQAKDAALFLTKIEAASKLRPQHPTMLYQLAAAYALNGRNDDALGALERVAAMGFVYAPDRVAEFAGLKDDARYKKVVETFAANAKPIGSPRLAFTIDKKGLIPEGLAYDRKTGRFFTGSVKTNAIYAGNNQVFATAPRGVFGLAVDFTRGLLWAATATVPASTSAVLKLDLATGRVLQTFDAPEGKHLFGDLTVASNGEVYVSDTESPTIYRIADGTMEPFVTIEHASLQGLAVAGHKLYVSDYTRGIYAIDLRTRDARLMSVPADVSLLGVDGVYLAKRNLLVATQNGTNPNRVIAIRLTADGLNVAGLETLAANNEELADPTLGVVVNGAFYFNANGQWEEKDEAKLEGARVLRVRF